MLQLSPSCENCDKLLPNESNEAMICTYYKDCVENILFNVCPNCGGFEKRPSRPKAQLEKYSLLCLARLPSLGFAEWLICIRLAAVVFVFRCSTTTSKNI